MTIEPPRGIKANLLRAYASQNDDFLQSCSRVNKPFCDDGKCSFSPLGVGVQNSSFLLVTFSRSDSRKKKVWSFGVQPSLRVYDW